MQTQSSKLETSFSYTTEQSVGKQKAVIQGDGRIATLQFSHTKTRKRFQGQEEKSLN